MDFFEELFEEFSEWLSELWETIVEIATIVWVHFENLFNNIIAFFQKKGLKYANKKELVGVSIKLKKLIDNKQYNSIKGVLRNPKSEVIMNVLFDKEKGEIVGEEDINIMEAKKLDKKTKDSFGDKPLLIIE